MPYRLDTKYPGRYFAARHAGDFQSAADAFQAAGISAQSYEKAAEQANRHRSPFTWIPIDAQFGAWILTSAVDPATSEMTLYIVDKCSIGTRDFALGYAVAKNRIGVDNDPSQEEWVVFQWTPLLDWTAA